MHKFSTITKFGTTQISQGLQKGLYLFLPYSCFTCFVQAYTQLLIFLIIPSTTQGYFLNNICNYFIITNKLKKKKKKLVYIPLSGTKRIYSRITRKCHTLFLFSENKICQLQTSVHAGTNESRSCVLTDMGEKYQ